jgi:hypothetical protein
MRAPERQLLQIVSQLPGTHDGVGDYALTLAKTLRANHGIETVFAVARTTDTREVDAFEVLPDFIVARTREELAQRCSHVLLHYVNYAYQRRGVPFSLRNFALQLRSQLRGRWLTMFHELYASGTPWQSAFWLRPWQVSIARRLIEISDVCFASNEPIERELHRQAPSKPVHVRPVMSNFGEPKLTNFDSRSLHRWAICGGSALLARSLRSFATLAGRIPAWCALGQLDVIGGGDTTDVRRALSDFADAHPRVTVGRFKQISADKASALLSECGFGWMDYFGAGKIWPGMIFKSGSFAACCAHGVIPVLSHDEPSLGLAGDVLPGPFCITSGEVRLPDSGNTAITREQIYRWYERNASSTATAQSYAEALR